MQNNQIHINKIQKQPKVCLQQIENYHLHHQLNMKSTNINKLNLKKFQYLINNNIKYLTSQLQLKTNPKNNQVNLKEEIFLNNFLKKMLQDL